MAWIVTREHYAEENRGIEPCYVGQKSDDWESEKLTTDDRYEWALIGNDGYWYLIGLSTVIDDALFIGLANDFGDVSHIAYENGTEFPPEEEEAGDLDQPTPELYP